MQFVRDGRLVAEKVEKMFLVKRADVEALKEVERKSGRPRQEDPAEGE